MLARRGGEVSKDSLSHASAQKRDAVMQAAAARAALLDALGESLVRYAEMLESGDVSDAAQCLELLAVRYRNAGELHRLEQFGDAFLPDE